jgi:hypothetical protein
LIGQGVSAVNLRRSAGTRHLTQSRVDAARQPSESEHRQAAKGEERRQLEQPEDEPRVVHHTFRPVAMLQAMTSRG